MTVEDQEYARCGQPKQLVLYAPAMLCSNETIFIFTAPRRCDQVEFSMFLYRLPAFESFTTTGALQGFSKIGTLQKQQNSTQTGIHSCQ